MFHTCETAEHRGENRRHDRSGDYTEGAGDNVAPKPVETRENARLQERNTTPFLLLFAAFP